MIKFLKGLFTGIIMMISISIVLVISLVISYSIYQNSKIYPEEIKIISEDCITIYQNQTYLLNPYLMNNEKIEDGQYIYESKNKNIIISQTGWIYVNEAPEEEYTITIYEINYHIKKDVLVNVKKAIDNNLNIINLDGLSMDYGKEYQFVVQGLSNDLTLDQNIFKTFDCNGNSIENVFKLSIENNMLTFQAIGLGEGKLLISINDNNQLFDFNIDLPNKRLTRDVVSNVEGKLLGLQDIENLETIYYSGIGLDINDLERFKRLKNIAFENYDVCKCLNLNSDKKYNYYVKEDLFLDYYNNIEWCDYKQYIKPYKNAVNDSKFVIYHDLKTNMILCQEVVENEFKLKNLSYIGYNHIGWSTSLDSENMIQSVDDVYNSTENCIELYAYWQPIKYFVEFHTTINGKDETLNTIKCTYNCQFDLKKIDITHKGYSFVGWSKTAIATSIIDEEDINNVEFNLINKSELSVSNLSLIDNYVVKLYDVWYVIKYNINYYSYGGNLEGELNYYTVNDSITLAVPVRKGYTFEGWYDNVYYNGNTISCINEGTIGEQNYYAKWSIITYNITYITNNGELSGQRLSYTVNDSVILAEPTYAGYGFIGWYDNSLFEGSKIIRIAKGTVGDKTYYARWVLTTDKWTSNERNLAVTPSEHIEETIEFSNINIADLLANGYTKVDLIITINYSSPYPNTKYFEILGVNKNLKGEFTSYNSSNKIISKIFTFECNIEELFNLNTTLRIKYHSKKILTMPFPWYLGYTEVTVNFS